jgi:hypothetical protein
VDPIGLHPPLYQLKKYRDSFTFTFTIALIVKRIISWDGNSYVITRRYIPKHKLHALYGPGYVIICAGNLTEEKFCVSLLKFPTGV